MSPANQFRQRVNGKLKPIRVGSGQSSHVSSVYFDPVTSLWKTSQDSSLKGWDSSSLTFPRSGTMRNGVVCRRHPSEPHTSETESSLLPTPTARDHLRPCPEGWHGKKGPHLRDAAQRWPTPISGDWKGQVRADGTAGMLSGKVAKGWEPKGWPTPQAHDVAKGDAKRVGRYGTKHGGRNLNDEVAKWPTPTARDWRSDSSKQTDAELYGKKGRPLPRVVGGQLNADWVSLLMGFSKTWTVVDGSAESLER